VGALFALQEVRQLGDVGGDAARLVAGQPLVDGATMRIAVIIDIRNGTLLDLTET